MLYRLMLFIDYLIYQSVFSAKVANRMEVIQAITFQLRQIQSMELQPC